MLDKDLAARLGVAALTVYRHRKVLAIPSYRRTETVLGMTTYARRMAHAGVLAR